MQDQLPSLLQWSSPTLISSSSSLSSSSSSWSSSSCSFHTRLSVPDLLLYHQYDNWQLIINCYNHHYHHHHSHDYNHHLSHFRYGRVSWICFNLDLHLNISPPTQAAPEWQWSWSAWWQCWWWSRWWWQHTKEKVLGSYKHCKNVENVISSNCSCIEAPQITTINFQCRFHFDSDWEPSLFHQTFHKGRGQKPQALKYKGI